MIPVLNYGPYRQFILKTYFPKTARAEKARRKRQLVILVAVLACLTAVLVGTKPEKGYETSFVGTCEIRVAVTIQVLRFFGWAPFGGRFDQPAPRGAMQVVSIEPARETERYTVHLAYDPEHPNNWAGAGAVRKVTVVETLEEALGWAVESCRVTPAGSSVRPGQRVNGSRI